MTVQIKRSVCPYDCPDTCSLLVHVDGSRVLKVVGDPDHPFTRGTLCPKMNHYEHTVHSPDRILQPLVRTGPKGEGHFKPVDWEEAIDHITSRWRGIIGSYGAEAILPYSYAGTMGLVQRNVGHAFFHRLGASRLERTICAPAKDFGWKAVMGNSAGLHPDEVADSDLVILWGINAVATNIHFLHGVREARRRGATVWVIDTYETPTAKTGDRTILTRPGTDGALALGLMHIIARDGLADQAFIARHVKGFEELKDRILPKYPPAVVSAITGISPEILEELAGAYAKARAPFIRLGSGLSRYGNGAMTIRTICCLPALVGAWAKKGGGLLSSIATGSTVNLSSITRENLMEKPTRLINMNELGDVLTGSLIPPIMSLYVYHSNPAAVTPDQNKVLTGLAREDLFTVVHERFMTDTAKFADIVLPATTSLEHSDLYRSFGHYGMQRAFPVISPVGDAKENWAVFQLLAEAMDFDDPFFKRTTDELIDHLLAKPKPWLAKVDMDRLRSGQPVELPLAPDYKTTFNTPSGQIEIYNETEAEPLPKYTHPHGDDAPYWLMSAPTPLMLNSSFNERDDLLAGEAMTLQMNPQNAAEKKLMEGDRVVAFNSRGEAVFILHVTPRVPQGVVVTEGVWWINRAPGSRTVNVLTSQRLTDQGNGSTFYDTKVDVRKE